MVWPCRHLYNVSKETSASLIGFFSFALSLSLHSDTDEICYTVTYFDCIEFRHILRNRIARYGLIFVNSLFDTAWVCVLCFVKFTRSILAVIYSHPYSIWFKTNSFHSFLFSKKQNWSLILFFGYCMPHSHYIWRWVLRFVAFTLHTELHREMWMFAQFLDDFSIFSTFAANRCIIYVHYILFFRLFFSFFFLWSTVVLCSLVRILKSILWAIWFLVLLLWSSPFSFIVLNRVNKWMCVTTE